MHHSFHDHVPLCFLPACVFHPLSAALWNQLCVYSTWFTCSKRASCQQPHCHFKSAQSDSLHRQEDHMSTSWYGCVYVFTCMLCACDAICSISFKLCLTSCAYWFYLRSSPGLPAAELSLDIGSVRPKPGWEMETSTRCLSVKDMFLFYQTCFIRKPNQLTRSGV